MFSNLCIPLTPSQQSTHTHTHTVSWNINHSLVWSPIHPPDTHLSALQPSCLHVRTGRAAMVTSTLIPAPRLKCALLMCITARCCSQHTLSWVCKTKLLSLKPLRSEARLCTTPLRLHTTPLILTKIYNPRWFHSIAWLAAVKPLSLKANGIYASLIRSHYIPNHLKCLLSHFINIPNRNPMLWN